MRIAHVLPRSSSKPEVALERDGHFYGVTGLFDAGIDKGWPDVTHGKSFHERVVAMGCAGFAELDRALLQGRRPRAAYLNPSDCLPLAPMEAERATLLLVDPRDNAGGERIAIGLGRSMMGDQALVTVDAPEVAESIEVEVGLGLLIGEELSRRDRSPRALESAIIGVSLFLGWKGSGTLRGTATQLGPVLLSGVRVRSLASRPQSVTIGDRRHSIAPIVEIEKIIGEALETAASVTGVAPGDVVAISPFASFRVGHHVRVEASIDEMMTLVGTAVPPSSPADVGGGGPARSR